ncbi:slipin family protein [Clostridium sediminicola]|uniref:slipin family protein n=1 Tax=Clostridium sediminicola TaxID=3114879 RepID=UPI0031F1FB9D
MKIIINENERGYLFKNGGFVKFLTPGKHSYLAMLGYTIEKVSLDGYVDLAGVNINVLLRDKDFSDSIVQIKVPDNSIAIHFIDGRIISTLISGEYEFWNIFEKHTFEIIDVCEPEVSKNMKLYLFKYISPNLYTKIQVSEGETALLYFDGKFQRELSKGVHYFWNTNVKVSHKIVDMRTQQLDICGQEILTTDKVSLRINFVYSYKVKDPVKLYSEIKDYETQVYIVTQLALREYVGMYKFDELLSQKEAIADFVLKKLKEKQDEYYIEFVNAGIKDIILPGEVRDIMNTVLIAEKTAQANVISRREEVASTRSLLNTAKLMDQNQTLYKLKELEYLEKICDKVGNISVSGGNNLLGQLNELLCERK